jgi:hypothetical protein
LTLWEIIWKDMIIPYQNNLIEDQTEEIILDAIIISLVAIKLIMRGCCSERVSLGLLIIWLLLEVLIV